MSRGGGSRTGGTGGSSGGGRSGSSSGGGGSSDGSSETAFATAGETLQEISSDADVARLARLVEATRVAKGHALNDRSSRSHCLVHVHVVQNVGGTVSKRQMLFVDLAGSEVRGFKCHQSLSVTNQCLCFSVYNLARFTTDLAILHSKYLSAYVSGGVLAREFYF